MDATIAEAGDGKVCVCLFPMLAEKRVVYCRRLWLALQIIIFSLLMVQARKLIQHTYFAADKPDEDYLTSGLLQFFYMLYGIIGGIVITHAWAKFRKLNKQLDIGYDGEESRNRKKKIFQRLSGERTHWGLRYAVDMLTMFILFFHLLMPVANYTTGCLGVFSIASVMYLIRTVIAQIDDPSQSIWIKSSIPKDWLLMEQKQH